MPLGPEQCQPLKRALETSRAAFKFVFIHHLVGGMDNQCLGGVEAALYYEWGGCNADGSEGFSQHRPSWLCPIHQLLVQNRMSIVFHGHVHFYAKQALDGIVYQEVPQPGYLDLLICLIMVWCELWRWRYEGLGACRKGLSPRRVVLRASRVKSQPKSRKLRNMSSITFIRAGTVLALYATTSLGLAQVTKPGQPAHTNGPPSVEIIAPQEGATFLVGQVIHVCASSQNFTDLVARVEFFAGTNSLGVVTNGLYLWNSMRLGDLREQSSCITWSNAAAGAYILTARATDLAGNTVNSAPVDISVVTNIPPLVHITQPRDDDLIRGPTNITVCASAFDPYGAVTTVEFFEDKTSLGVVTNMGPYYVTNRHGVFPIPQTSYCLTWSNVALGTHTLTAVATDNGGVSATSAPVQITVVSTCRRW